MSVDAFEIGALDAHDQARLLREGELTRTELIEAAIERLTRWNPYVNAVCVAWLEEALEVARRAPSARSPSAGVFDGVPALLKDLGSTRAGAPMTCGSSFLRGVVPPHDSELYRRMDRAGLVFLGKGNASEFGLLPTTEPRLYGATRNPWDLTRSAGGSSGGPAAAVACRIVPLAHANDGGGSIRIPAACCGVFGLKPTRARTPLGPDVGDIMNGLVVEHAVTVSVRDSAALLDATHGASAGDPYVAPPPRGTFMDAVSRPVRRLRVAFHTGGGLQAPSEPCIRAVRDAAELCAELGHEVVEARPPVTMEQVVESLQILWTSGVAATLDALSHVTGRPLRSEYFEPLTWTLYEAGRAVPAAGYLNAVTRIQQQARHIAEFFETYDVVLNATTASPPPCLGELDGSEGHWDRFQHALAYTLESPVANLTGQPAMSVPLHWNAASQPVGVHFTGRFGDEATLLGLAAQLESTRPWAARRPSLPA